MGWSPQITLAGTFFAVAALAGLVGLWVFGGDPQTEQRLGELADPQSSLLRRRPRHARQPIGGRIQSALASLGLRLLPAKAAAHHRLQDLFLHAGMYAASGPFVYTAVRFVLGLVLPLMILGGGALGIVDFWTSVCIAAGAGCAGMMLPAFWLRWRVGRRQLRLRTMLPDFLDLTVTCLEAGQSFEAALQRVTDEMREAHPILALELTIVQREMAFGASPHRAIRNFADRSGLEVVRTLATFVEQAQKYGCSMTESLRTHAEMLRDLREQRAEELAQKAAVKILFPTLLFIFPPILITLAGPAVLDFRQKLGPETSAPAPSELP
jgi:tight adherence protein C